jgi:hypothetical protein
VTIVPDTKDWTWVLDRPCPECGLDTQRRGDGARFTVESFARYLVHDPVHHLFDVTGARHSSRPVAEN